MLLRSTLAVLLAVPAAATAAAADDPTVGVDVKDERRDVRIYSRVEGPPARDRRSIDLRRVVVAPDAEPGTDTVRFRLRVRRLLPEAPFDQAADVLLLPPEGADVDWAGTEIWISTHRPRSSFAALYSTVSEPVRCRHLPTASDPVTGWFWVDVPRICLPPGEVVVEVQTLATTARNKARPYSSDDLAVPGTVVWDAPVAPVAPV